VGHTVTASCRFVDVPLVVTIEMPSAILDAETLPRKDKDTPPGDQDVRVIEVESFFVLSVLLLIRQCQPNR